MLVVKGSLRARLLAVLLASLAGCAPGIDAGQGRLCRAIIPALNGEAAAIEIVRTGPLAAGHGVRVDYRGPSPAGQRSRFLECRFAGAMEAGPERAGLTGVTTEDGPIGDVRLYLLKRFGWAPTPRPPIPSP